MKILGLSYMYHDSAAALVVDGEIIAASAEERFLRVKHTVEFPVHAIDDVLQQGGVSIHDLDAIVFYEKPFLKFERILTTHVSMWPFSWKSFRAFLPMWLNYKLRVPQIIRERTGYRGPILFTDHHYAHAASAFLPSPFEEAIVLTTDGTGEWSTAAWGVGRGTKISLEHDLRFPHSIGLLYSAVTAHLGFKVNGGEGKVMGLASFGKPRFLEDFKKFVHLRDDGSFQLDMDYFSFHWDLVMTNEKFAAATIPLREPESEVRPEHEDLAATLQHITEEIILRTVRTAHKKYGIDKLVMAGGVALNCVANGRILRETPIKEVWTQPAAGDDGGSVGAALYAYTQRFGGTKRVEMRHACLGPSYPPDRIQSSLDRRSLRYEVLDESQIGERAAEMLADGRVIGWFQGRMEYGPRALGARSILADPRAAAMRDRVNVAIKRREMFRPFAPAVLEEAAADWFELPVPSPFMLLAVPVRAEKRAQIEAITHVDGTARVQTVTQADNGRFHEVIAAFGRRTGVPMVLNTSFNVRGQPIVNTPDEAIDGFLSMGMDALVIDRFLVLRPEATP